MTPVQEATYPIIAEGRDLCALAETGSGKTAACAIPLIQKIDTSQNTIQALVIVPTRELCLQYVEDIQKIGGTFSVVPFGIYGGFDKGIQVAKLRHKVHVLVATPGRLIDLLYDGEIILSQVKCLILDEADELFKEGFIQDIEFIISCILHEHQTILFSATMPDDIKKLADKHMIDPRHISLITNRSSPASIEHYFNYVTPQHKHSALVNYLNRQDIDQVIIFCNARHQVDKLFHSLHQQIKNVEYIHAGLLQNKRSSIIRRFREQKIRYLIATDVAGRGLDFSHVSHVVNWDFPNEREKYTHRTGRTGRMGGKGTAITFVTKKDLSSLQRLIHQKKIVPRWIGENPLQEGIAYRPHTPRRPGNRRSFDRRRGR